jgi:hypothetical protein
MGLDDELEKLRQAEAWLTGEATAEQHDAAIEHAAHVLYTTERQDLRHRAYHLLEPSWAPC